MKGSVDENRKPYECDSNFDLNENIETNKTGAVHEGFTCKLCSKVFITKYSLLNEESVHAENFPLENHIENEHTEKTKGQLFLKQHCRADLSTIETSLHSQTNQKNSNF